MASGRLNSTRLAGSVVIKAAQDSSSRQSRIAQRRNGAREPQGLRKKLQAETGQHDERQKRNRHKIGHKP